MKVVIASALLFGLATALAGCGGSDSKTGKTTASSVAAPTKAAGTTTTAGATPSAPAPTSAAASTGSGGDDTCKYLSASEATALVASVGAAKVTTADTAATKQTSCTWGSLRSGSDGILVIVSEIKISSAINAIKTKMEKELVEKVDGLGDKGGFQTKDAEAVTVTFIKGSTQVSLIVNGTTGVKADAVLAAAKKIAAGL